MSSSGLNLESYLIPLDEIKRATENFSTCIGGGGFGGVYKGQLSESSNNCTAAVKRLDPKSFQGEREFRNEVKLISKFHHENIISFIGYCDEEKEMIIVYEHATNGSLDHQLEYPNKMSSVTWKQRLEICLGAAKGLNYLHSGLGEHDIVIHRDVKSANILLDGNMVAKICDFGLSKSSSTNQPDTQHVTRVAGTQYYMDPSYHESGILQKESDVYSFGVVLFEMLSGMLVYHKKIFGDEKQLLMTAVRRYQEDEPEYLIDPCVRDQINSRSFETFQEIAYQCIELKPVDRPMLHTVIEKIEEALSIQISERSVSSLEEDFTIETLIRKLDSKRSYHQRLASGEIFRLMKSSQGNRDAFVKAGVIPLLTRILTKGESRTQEHAVNILDGLWGFEEYRNIMMSSGAVRGLLHVLTTTCSMAAKEKTVYMLEILSISEDDIPYEDNEVIRCLVLMLRSDQADKESVVCVLHRLYKSNSKMVMREGVVPVLIDLFTSPDTRPRNTRLKETILDMLFKVSLQPEGRQAISKAEGVPLLVEVFRNSVDRSSESSIAYILAEFCLDDQNYMVEFQEVGIMDKMIDLLDDNKWETGWEIAQQLLQQVPEHAGESMIEILLGKLISISPDEQWIASRKIFHFVDSSIENSDAFIEAGGIPLLTGILTKGESRTQEYALSTFMRLCEPAKNIDIMRSSGTVPGILNLLSTPFSTEVQENIAFILHRLTISDDDVPYEANEAIQCLVTLMLTGTNNASYVIYVLNRLCIYESNKIMAVRAGVVEPLMELFALRSINSTLKENLVSMLFTLSQEPEGRQAIGKEKAVPILVRAIEDSWYPRNFAAMAAFILAELCLEDQQYLVEAKELGILGKMLELLENSEWDAGEGQAKQLRKIEDCAEAETLLHQLKSISPDEQCIASSEISRLTKVSTEKCIAFVKCGVIPVLTRVLTEGGFQTQKHVVSTLLTIFSTENKDIMMSSGAIPGLVHVLRTTCSMMAMKDTTKISTGPDTIDLKDEALILLFKLSQEPEGRKAIDKSEAMPILAKFIGNSDQIFASTAAFILAELCLDDEKYFMDVGELGIMVRMIYLLQNSEWDAGERIAKQLLEKIKDSA